MKQTNNAIKFLMAQYRAIFQNAYFKGLATAAVVTMGLAVGQAQATESVTDQASWEKLEGHELTGTIAVSGDTAAVTAKNTKAGGFTLSLTGAANKIQGTGNAVSLTAENGTLKLATTGSSLSVGVSTGDSGTTLNIKAFDIQEGTITVANTKDKTTTVGVKNVTVGEKGVLALTGGADSGADTNLKFGDSATTYNLTSGSTVNLTKANWEGDISNASDVNINIKDASTIKNYGTNVKANITVEAQKTGTIELADVESSKNKDEGTLQLVSGSTINIGGDGTSGAILNLKAGKLILNDGVVVANTSSDNSAADKAGTLKIGGDTPEATLSLSKTTFDNFLNGDKKGVLDISKSGTVAVSGDIDLADYTFATSGALGSIAMSDTTAKLSATNVVAKKALSGTATNANIVATGTLTLGGTAAIGAASLEAKNLAIDVVGTEYALQDDVTLKSMADSTDANGAQIKVAQEGTITGNNINVSGGKSLTIAAGNYEFANNLTLTSGSLTVSSAVDADGSAGNATVASKLTLTGDIVLQNKANNGITVSGTNAVLDLSQASSLTTAKHNDDDGDIAIAAQDGATLIMTGEQVTGFIGDVKDTAATKKASITLSGGAALNLDELTIDGDQLKSEAVASLGAGKGKITFDTTAVNTSNPAGYLNVDGTLTLNKATTAIEIGQYGAIKADKIVLKSTTPASDTEVLLGAGQYTVLSGLEADKSIKLSDTNSKLFLGAVDTNKDGVSTPLATTGKITADLNIATGSGSVVAGDWTAQKNVTAAASTKLNIGDSTLVDALNEPISAKLTVAGKLSAEANTVTVNKGSELVVNEIAASGTAITITTFAKYLDFSYIATI